MQSFVTKHADKITGVLACFDRLIFKGYLPFSHPRGMEAFLAQQGILLKDFRNFALGHSAPVKAHGLALAEQAGRPYIFLRKRIRKEDRVRQMIRAEGLTEGLVCVFGVQESCSSGAHKGTAYFPARMHNGPFPARDGYRENHQEASLSRRLEWFLPELGNYPTFVGRQRRLPVDDRTHA